MSFTITLIVGAMVLAVLVIGTYNNLVSLRQNVRESWSAIDTELRRRFDLIPNLVETVKGYASHEHNTLEDVIKARNQAYVQAPIEQQMQAQNVLSAALGKLIALSESYPQLKANENFMALQNELNETETRISQARRFYNANVKDFNTACQTLPGALIAGSFGFRPQPYYGLDNERAYQPVSVSFSGTNTGNPNLDVIGSTDNGQQVQLSDQQAEKQ